MHFLILINDRRNATVSAIDTAENCSVNAALNGLQIGEQMHNTKITHTHTPTNTEQDDAHALYILFAVCMFKWLAVADKRNKYSIQIVCKRNQIQTNNERTTLNRTLKESWAMAQVITGYWTSYLVPNNVVISYTYNTVYRINGIAIDNNNDSSWKISAVAAIFFRYFVFVAVLFANIFRTNAIFVVALEKWALESTL